MSKHGTAIVFWASVISAGNILQMDMTEEPYFLGLAFKCIAVVIAAQAAHSYQEFFRTKP